MLIGFPVGRGLSLEASKLPFLWNFCEVPRFTGHSSRAFLRAAGGLARGESLIWICFQTNASKKASGSPENALLWFNDWSEQTAPLPKWDYLSIYLFIYNTALRTDHILNAAVQSSHTHHVHVAKSVPLSKFISEVSTISIFKPASKSHKHFQWL